MTEKQCCSIRVEPRIVPFRYGRVTEDDRVSRWGSLANLRNTPFWLACGDFPPMTHAACSLTIALSRERSALAVMDSCAKRPAGIKQGCGRRRRSLRGHIRPVTGSCPVDGYAALTSVSRISVTILATRPPIRSSATTAGSSLSNWPSRARRLASATACVFWTWKGPVWQISAPG